MATELFKGLGHAKLYSKFRPLPPEKLISSILTFLKEKITPPFETAVDIGCGNGQSTVVLSPHFKKVSGFDVSPAQIDLALKTNVLPNIQYSVTDGKTFDIPSSSVQLVTFCQALHWFDAKDIFEQVERMLVPGGVVAAYGHKYLIPVTKDPFKNQEIEDLFKKNFLDEKLKPYFHERMQSSRKKYEDVEFPFKDKERFEMVTETESNLSSYMGYLTTSSFYQSFLKANENQAKAFLDDMTKKILRILDESRPCEEVPVVLRGDHFMIMGRK